MTKHQKAQQLAKNYYTFLMRNGSNAAFAWGQAMIIFKLEMQK